MFVIDPEARYGFRQMETKTALKSAAFAERTAQGALRAVISTNDLDRDGRIVEQDGWELDNFKVNPVVLWNHDYDELPLARVDVAVEDGKLMASNFRWAKHPLALFVKEMYDPSDGSEPIMNSFSVGWMPKEFAEEKNDDDGYLCRYTKQELIELSTTPLPSNVSARAVAASLGVVIAESPTPEPVPPPGPVTPPEPAPEPVPVETPLAGSAVEGAEVPSPPETSPSPEPVAEVPDTEAAELLAARHPSADEAADQNDGEGSAPEQASGLTTRQHAERVAEVAAIAADLVYKRLTGRLPE